MEPLYGEPYFITIGDKAYQIQSVDRDCNTSFILKNPGKQPCKIFLNSEGGWENDCALSVGEFNEALQWIKTLYE
jgi:hypothetical protein